MTPSAFFGAITDDDRRIAMSQIAELVAEVELALTEKAKSSVPLVAEIAGHTLAAGGKRLRPAFVALAARSTGRPVDPDRVREIGACMEMIHMATLIHDDVIDNAATRRGRETASNVFGNCASILTGDVLLSKAMAILADDGDLDIIRMVSRAVVDMAEGEVREVATRGDFNLAVEEHLEILRMKTAGFIECCCGVGATIAGSDESVRIALSSYGRNIGLAFQIVDDILDYRGNRSETGKPVATDFREGCATLPLIYLRPTLSEDEFAFTRRKFGNGVVDDEIGLINSWMDDRGAFEQAARLAESFAKAAIDDLTYLPATPQRDLLAAAVDFVLNRSF